MILFLILPPCMSFFDCRGGGGISWEHAVIELLTLSAHDFRHEYEGGCAASR